MAVCVIYNPDNVSAKAIIVNIPFTASLKYAHQLAMKEKQKDRYYNSITCKVNVIGDEDNAKYVAFLRRLNYFEPIAIGDNIDSLYQMYGSSVIVSPLERLLIKSLNELMALM